MNMHATYYRNLYHTHFRIGRGPNSVTYQCYDLTRDNAAAAKGGKQGLNGGIVDNKPAGCLNSLADFTNNI